MKTLGILCIPVRGSKTYTELHFFTAARALWTNDLILRDRYTPIAPRIKFLNLVECFGVGHRTLWCDEACRRVIHEHIQVTPHRQRRGACRRCRTGIRNCRSRRARLHAEGRQNSGDFGSATIACDPPGPVWDYSVRMRPCQCVQACRGGALPSLTSVVAISGLHNPASLQLG